MPKIIFYFGEKVGIIPAPLFKEWFEVVPHSMVFDMVDEDVEAEEL